MSGTHAWVQMASIGGLAAVCAALLVGLPATTSALVGLDGPQCSLAAFGSMAQAMNAACCPPKSKCAKTGPAELPKTCTTKCAMAFHPFFVKCEKTLGHLYGDSGSAHLAKFNLKCIATEAAPVIKRIDELTAAGCKFNVSSIVAKGCVDSTDSIVNASTKGVVAGCHKAAELGLCTKAPADAAKICPVTCKLGCGKAVSTSTSGSRRSMFAVMMNNACSDQEFKTKLEQVKVACVGSSASKGGIPTDCSYTCAKVVPGFFKKCSQKIKSDLAKVASTQLERLAATCDKFPTQVLLRALGNSPCFKKHSGPCAADGKKIKALRAEAQANTTRKLQALRAEAQANTTRKLQEQKQSFEPKFAAISTQLAAMKATITSLTAKVDKPAAPTAPKASKELLALNKTMMSIKNLVDMGRLLSPGTIVMWAGNATKIPNGWSVCNGKSGTPDLQDKFVLGAGPSHKAGAKASAKRSTKANMCYATSRYTCENGYSGFTGLTGLTDYAPAYYALAYIMRTNSYCCKCKCSVTSTIESSAIPLVGQDPTDRCTKHCGAKAEACPGGTFGQFVGFC